MQEKYTDAIHMQAQLSLYTYTESDQHFHCLFTFKLPLSYWAQIYPAFANSVDPDQLASSEANWSGSALFDIKSVNL